MRSSAASLLLFLAIEWISMFVFSSVPRLPMSETPPDPTRWPSAMWPPHSLQNLHSSVPHAETMCQSLASPLAFAIQSTPQAGPVVHWGRCLDAPTQNSLLSLAGPRADLFERRQVDRTRDRELGVGGAAAEASPRLRHTFDGETIQASRTLVRDG